MAKKIKKEEPRYPVQKQLEASFKTSYYKMLTNMSKGIIATLIKQEHVTDTRTS